MATPKREIGDIGENCAEKFLAKRGFTILDRNYLKKWGELDIVAKRGSVLHFVEVKTVSKKYSPRDEWRPEDNVHSWKKKRLSRAIQTYLLEKHIKDDAEWCVDVIVVYLDFIRHVATIRTIEDVVL